MHLQFKTITVFLLLIISLFPLSSTAQTTVVEAPFSQKEIEQMVAPIALYSDDLLAQILMAATYPLEVVTATHWAKANPNLKGKNLEDTLVQQPWDPSIKALVPMPQVLDMLNENIEMTRTLGDAFLSQQKDVMDAIQRLRRTAQIQGNLKSTNEQTVTTVEHGGTAVIEITATDPKTIYVPSYNPEVVYGTWPYSDYPPYAYYPPYYGGHYYGNGYLTYGLGYTLGYALWAHMNWYNDDIDINVNRFNEINRTSITENRWQHNPEHRKGVQYRDYATLQKYQGDQFKNMQARQDFRGRPGQEPKWFERADINTPSSYFAKAENLNRSNERINQGGQRVNRGDQQASQRAQNIANQQSLAQQKQQFQKQWQADQQHVTQRAQQETLAKQQRQQQAQQEMAQQQRQQQLQQRQQLQQEKTQQREAQQRRQQQRASNHAALNRPANIQRPTAFDGINQGAEVRDFSNRGAASRQSIADHARNGGGVAHRGGGGRRGGGRR